MIKVLIADDHPYLIHGVASALQGFGMEVCGQASTPEEAIELYKTTAPDVVITDIMFKGKQSGLNVLEDLLAMDRKANVIMLSQYDSQTLIQQAYKLGAKAFLAKTIELSELEEAIEQAAKGKHYFPAGVAENLAMMNVPSGDADNNPARILDDKELAIFLLLARGRTQAEVAEETGISMRTVSAKIASLKEKLQESRTPRLAMLAIKHGLINIDDTLGLKD